MADTLSEFYNSIRLALGRGASLDAEIPAKVKMAVRFIERNFSMKYMERFGTVVVDADTDFPDTITLPNCHVKSVRFLRFASGPTGGERYVYLRKISPEEAYGPSSLFTDWQGNKIPRRYWQFGKSALKLDSPVISTLTFEIQWYQYTDWPEQIDDTVCPPWLVQNAEDVLFAQTMLFFSPRLRDPRMWQTFSTMRDEGLKTLSIGDDEADELGATTVMQYGQGPS